jgi:putative ABC transport system permease protein
VNYGALFQSALVALLRNKLRSILTVLGITIGIAAVICVVAIGKAGQARVQQQLNNFGTTLCGSKQAAAQLTVSAPAHTIRSPLPWPTPSQ